MDNSQNFSQAIEMHEMSESILYFIYISNTKVYTTQITGQTYTFFTWIQLHTNRYTYIHVEHAIQEYEILTRTVHTLL